MLHELLISAFFAFAISAFSYFSRLLTAGGAFAQFTLGLLLLGFGGWQWVLPILSFFLLSSLLSRIKNQRRAAAETFFAKSSQRDAMQVIANGGISGGLVLLWWASHSNALYVAYLGAIAAVTADTWGTEIGTLANSPPRLITNGKPVEAGRSGGVTLLGIVAGLGGSIAILLSGLFWAESAWAVSLAVILGGLVGTLTDSVLGATIQAQYICPNCSRIVEKMCHCGIETEIHSGVLWATNDVINFFASISGAVASFVIYHLST